MDNCPQEIVDLVIDQLAKLESLDQHQSLAAGRMSTYSTISRQWVERTQFHNFRELDLLSQQQLNRWRTAVAPDPQGISRYVVAIRLYDINTLEGFEDHICAFTKLEEACFDFCEILRSLDDIQRLAPLRESLVYVALHRLVIPPEVMARFLSLLPRLREIHASKVGTPHGSVQVLHPTIPFFEGGNKLSLFNLEGGLEWIPPTAQFAELSLDRKCLRRDQKAVNQWIASSRKRLKVLRISADDGLSDYNFDPLNLSGCASLEALDLRLPIDLESLTDIVLPSISSLVLSRVALRIDSNHKLLDPHFLERLEMCLCRLAKMFKSARGERKMVVEFPVRWNLAMFNIFQNKQLMPELNREATIEVYRTF